MKFRWFVLFFLFGLLGCVAIGFLKFTAPPDSSYEALPPSIESASTSGSPPFIPDLAPTPPILEPPSLTKVESAEKAIANALTQIPKGDIYHNVPKEMQVGVPKTIEAGIAPKVTEQIRKKLQGRGDINVESGVRFDPSGMEMKLVA